MRIYNDITKKVFYKRIPNRIKIVKLFKKLFSIAYRGKEVNQVLANIRNKSNKRVRKSRGL